MPRKKGSANSDFAESRQALLHRLRLGLLAETPPASLRALAKAAGVSIPTLRHYFGDREGVVEAVFADCRAGGEKELATAANPSGGFEGSIRDLVMHIAAGFRYGGLTRLHAVGIVEGVVEPRAAGSYLREILDPTIAAAQARLEVHVARGEMTASDLRNAAIGLLGPILVAFLHQDSLGGSATAPIDLDVLLRDHATAFVAAHRRES